MVARLATAHALTVDAVEFIRFCHARRRVGWPELYDEMCAVAGRGLYRGWGSDELRAEGIGFSLFEMPALAVVVHRVAAEEHERRRIDRAIAAEAAACRPATEPATEPTGPDSAGALGYARATAGA